MTTRRYRIGVIGAGARGETFARKLYSGTHRAELFGICDIDEDRLGKFCDYCELPEVKRFTDPREFLTHRDLDAVIVTTPEFTHAEVAVTAMRAGKHVYLEKPMAHTVEDCREIMRVHRESGVTAYLGFNNRATPIRQKFKEILASGVLGQLVNADGLEQLAQAHGAAYMRRFHRKSSNSGGLLNHKGSHDLDILLWFVGHAHKVVKVSSFGGVNVLTPDKRPAERCRDCPTDIYTSCPYRAVPGYAFPIHHAEPLYHRDSERYGGDLCVYTDDKDIIDNQTVMLEWDSGVRGNYSMQMFQAHGGRRNRFLGEKGVAELDDLELSAHGERSGVIHVTLSDSGDTAEYRFTKREGGHGGSDPVMLSRFVAAIDSGGKTDSGLQAGLAATLVAIKADESRLTGQTVSIDPGEYGL